MAENKVFLQNGGRLMMPGQRLLITDSYTSQSYDIMLALSGYCDKIVVTIQRICRFPGLFSFSAHSRLVSKIYRLKTERPPMARSIVLDKDYSVAAEKRYIDEIMGICRREQINLIYPSSDDEVILLSRHKSLFEEKGVFIPINEYEVLKNLADKYSVIMLARQKGIPCPRTCLASEAESLFLGRVRSSDPVIVIKPRFGSGSRGTFFVNRKEDLQRWLAENSSAVHHFVAQEYIPGDTIVNLRVYMKQDGIPMHASCSACKRPALIIHQSAGIIHAKASFPPSYENIVALFREQKFIGYGHAQFKIDSRDGMPKLMEINVRLGRGTWTEERQGINRPLISLAIFKNRTIEIKEAGAEIDVIFVYPVQDILIFVFYLLFWLEGALRKIFLLEGRKRLPGLRQMLSHYRQIYFSGRKIECDNCLKFFFKDPLVSLTFWFSFCHQLRKKFKDWNF